MPRNGVQVSQGGINVEDAADYELALSSEWPLLKVLHTGNITYDAALNIYCTSDALIQGDFSGENIIYRHGLGYMCPFILIPQDTDGTANSKLTAPVLYHYILFDHDVTETVPRQAKSATPAATGSSAYGVETLGDGKRINSTDMRDFSVNTKARPMQIHMGGTLHPDGLGTPITVEHDLGYLPTYLFFQGSFIGKYNDTLHGVEKGAAVATATSSTITFQGAQAILSDPVYYLILKDPILTI